MLADRDESEIEQLSRLCAPEDEPRLSEDELTDILGRHRRYRVWTAATTYRIGQRIVPTVPDGRLYRCVRPGTSGATEPSWPTARYPYLNAEMYQSQLRGIRTTDGANDATAAVWEDAGPMPASQYDIKAAAHDAWEIKAARTAKLMDIASGPDRLNLSQQHKHCLAMAARYGSVSVV